MNKNKLIRITTVPVSLEKLLENQLSFMNHYYDVIAVSSDKERLYNFGKEQKIKTFNIELTRRITPIQDLKSLFILYNFLKKEKPQIVHTHTPKAGIVGMLAAYLAKVPNRLHTVAGLPLMESKGLKRMVLGFVEKLTYSCATKVYPNSYGLKEIILNNKFVEEKKLKVIGNGSSNGIDTKYFNPELYSKEFIDNFRAELKISKEDFVFVFVGRIVGDKGINELVSAFEEINTKIKNVKLLLVGPFEEELDPLSESVKTIIETNNNVISVGFKNDVRPYFIISDVLTFPSYREGFPNVVMQAAAMKLPCIVSDINGCNEIIRAGVNGAIIPPKNTEDLYKVMKSFYRMSKTNLKEMGEASRKEIIEKYERKVIWNALLNEYKMLEDV